MLRVPFPPLRGWPEKEEQHDDKTERRRRRCSAADMPATKAACAGAPEDSPFLSEEKKIWPVTAMPSALPTCWNACSAPEPEPASRGGTATAPLEQRRDAGPGPGRTGTAAGQSSSGRGCRRGRRGRPQADHADDQQQAPAISRGQRLPSRPETSETISTPSGNGIVVRPDAGRQPEARLQEQREDHEEAGDAREEDGGISVPSTKLPLVIRLTGSSSLLPAASRRFS